MFPTIFILLISMGNRTFKSSRTPDYSRMYANVTCIFARTFVKRTETANVISTRIALIIKPAKLRGKRRLPSHHLRDANSLKLSSTAARHDAFYDEMLERETVLGGSVGRISRWSRKGKVRVKVCVDTHGGVYTVSDNVIATSVTCILRRVSRGSIALA